MNIWKNWLLWAVAFAVFLLSGAVYLAHAEDKPKNQPTVAELSFELAQKDLEIATLKQQLLQAQAMIQLLQSPQFQLEAVKAQQAIEIAKQKVADATPKPKETAKN